MANDSDFQDRVRRLGQLIAQFDLQPDSPQKASAKELVQLLMDVHGTGLERVMEIVFESGDLGQKIIDRLGQDSVVGSLLLLYSLHPDDLETRLLKAMDRMRPRLRKLASTAELVKADADSVQIRLMTAGHSCGSSSGELKTIVEDCVFESAPDVTSLEILGLEEPEPAGFVSLESLLGHSMIATNSNGHALRTERGD